MVSPNFPYGFRPKTIGKGSLWSTSTTQGRLHCTQHLRTKYRFHPKP